MKNLYILLCSFFFIGCATNAAKIEGMKLSVRDKNNVTIQYFVDQFRDKSISLDDHALLYTSVYTEHKKTIRGAIFETEKLLFVIRSINGKLGGSSLMSTICSGNVGLVPPGTNHIILRPGEAIGDDLIFEYKFEPGKIYILKGNREYVENKIYVNSWVESIDESFEKADEREKILLNKLSENINIEKEKYRKKKKL